MRGCVAFLLVWLVAAVDVSAQPTPPPAEAFGRLPAVSEVEISRDGRQIVLQQSNGPISALRVIELDTQQSIYSARIEAPTTLRGVGWADDEHVVFYVSTTANTGSMNVYVRGSTKLEYWRAGVVNLRTGRQAFMLEDLEDANLRPGLVSLMAPIEGDAGYGRMLSYDREGDSSRLVIYRVNLNNGRFTLANRGDGSLADDYLLDERGQIVARTDSDQRSNEWWLYNYDSGQPRLLHRGTHETGGSPGLYGLLADGRLVASMIEDNTYRLTAIDRSTGAQERLQTEHPESNCAVVDSWTIRVVGLCWTEVFTRYRYFEADLQAVQTAIEEHFVGGVARITGWSHDRSRFVIYAETPRDAGAFYVYEPQRNNIIQVGLRYPELQGANFGVRQEIRYPARDGVQVPAYLHLPAAGARNLPLVLLVHGGPHSRVDFEFDWWAAFLVSRGYAVLQPNFRGSTGFGRDWFVDGRGQWGDGVMQTDVIDGVDALIRQGIADPRRVCIMGASYGGYAALAGATLTPDKFACAVSVAGVSDLLQMLEDESVGGSRSGAADWWRLSIGDPRASREHLRSISPVNRVADVSAPILLMHGNQDTVVPIDQTRRMVTALRDAGKDVRFVELTGDDHWLSDASTRTQMLREIDNFLAQHLGGRGH